MKFIVCAALMSLVAGGDTQYYRAQMVNNQGQRFVPMVTTNDTAEVCSGTKCSGYRGTLNKTIYGLTCQNWNSDSPHKHSNKPYQKRGKGLEDGAYCRNPDGSNTIWCYTTDPSIRWQYCSISNSDAEGCISQYQRLMVSDYPKMNNKDELAAYIRKTYPKSIGFTVHPNYFTDKDRRYVAYIIQNTCASQTYIGWEAYYWNEVCYKHVVGCVNGENIKWYQGQTLESCKQICNKNSDCLGVEFYVKYNASKVSDSYKEGSCNESSSTDTTNCDYQYYQLNLWKKVPCPNDLSNKNILEEDEQLNDYQEVEDFEDNFLL